uniref:Uncharacterized protein n=1 Tax=Cacopsylla melanoneura TaxID=428564 RepID=A0A8D8YW94_9HEMI
MSKLSATELKNAYSESKPGFSSYIDCMTRTLLTGAASFALTCSSAYLGQTLLYNYIPTSRNNRFLTSTVVALLVSYQVTRTKAKVCQEIAYELEKNKPKSE